MTKIRNKNMKQKYCKTKTCNRLGQCLEAGKSSCDPPHCINFILPLVFLLVSKAKKMSPQKNILQVENLFSAKHTHCNISLSFKPLTIYSPLLTTLKKKPLANIVGKGENAGKQHFLLFEQCFLPIPKRITVFK